LLIAIAKVVQKIESANFMQFFWLLLMWFFCNSIVTTLQSVICVFLWYSRKIMRLSAIIINIKIVCCGQTIFILILVYIFLSVPHQGNVQRVLRPSGCGGIGTR